MKILIARTYPSYISSTSYNVQEIGLAAAYIRAGHEADIVLYGGRADDHTEILPVDVPEDMDTSVIDVDDDSDEHYISIYYLRGYRILKNGIYPSLMEIARGYDVIQVHEYDQISSWLLYTDKKLRDRVIIYHGPYYSAFNKGYNIRSGVFDKIFLRLRHNRDCKCFTKSNAATEFLRSKGFSNVKSVGVGLDTDVWGNADNVIVQSRMLKENPQSISQAIGSTVSFGDRLRTVDSNVTAKSDMFTYAYIGKLEPRRNTLFLLDVIDALLSTHDDMRFIMVGDGEKNYRQQCLDKAKKWIDLGRIIYIPSVNQKDIPLVYGQADCMLFPSEYEIFGMVLMEAMYFGVPVITSDNGGADMLFENGRNAIVIESCGSKNPKESDQEALRSHFEFNEWINKAIRIYEDRELWSSISESELSDSEKLTWDAVASSILSEII